MIIHQKDQVWYAESDYKEKDTLKANGWWWHSGYSCRSTCQACKSHLGRTWWTGKIDSALALVEYADAQAKAALHAYQSKATESLSASMATEASEAFSAPAPEGMAYYPFQLAGIEFASKRKHTLIADEMGLGKTIQALGAINANPDIKKVMVICPASLKLNWQREAEQWLTRPLSVHVCNGKNPDMDADMLIINYERARKLDTMKQLASREWDLLIIDESHRLKNPKALQTKRILGPVPKGQESSLFTHVKRSIFLTGTPVLNRPRELWPTVSTLAPEQFPRFFSFGKRFCNAYQERHRGVIHWNFDGASNLQELQEKLRASIMIRRKKDEVWKEMPEKTRSILPLEPNDKSVKQLLKQEQSILKNMKVKDDMDWEDIVSTLKGDHVAFDQIARVRHDLAIAKLPLAIEHIANALEQQNKVVVFAHHRDVVEGIEEAFGDVAVKLYGGMKDSDKQKAIDRFQNDQECKVFVGSILASGVGITLTAASIAIFAELDWVPANVFQAEDRLHRIGQVN